jgi:dihydropteroate synthase
MGIVNVTPDSFSDGGASCDRAGALDRALRLIAEGADILDVGGESTRPGAQPVGADEEVARVIPLVEAVRARTDAPLSIDSMKPAVARAAVAAGATMWNDVTALSWSPESLNTAAELACDVVLMHMQGDPRTMQVAPSYDDIVTEVCAYLVSRAEAAMAAGVTRERIHLDPGIGFGKTAAHNLALLRGLGDIVALGFPVVLGVSRKGFIKTVDPTAQSPNDRLGASLAVALAAAEAGVAILRVHDVRETAQALAMRAALRD